MISDRISGADIPRQMKILNILLHFCSFESNLSVESHIKANAIQRNDIKIFPTVLQIFDVIQSDSA